MECQHSVLVRLYYKLWRYGADQWVVVCWFQLWVSFRGFPSWPKQHDSRLRQNNSGSLESHLWVTIQRNYLFLFGRDDKEPTRHMDAKQKFMKVIYSPPRFLPLFAHSPATNFPSILFFFCEEVKTKVKWEQNLRELPRPSFDRTSCEWRLIIDQRKVDWLGKLRIYWFSAVINGMDVVAFTAALPLLEIRLSVT